MARTSAAAVNPTAFLAIFTVCLTAAGADHPGHDALCPSTEMTSGPPIADSLVTSYLSVDGPGSVLCGMRYVVPAGSTLYQGMLAASQQHGNFRFKSTVHPIWGHFISSINGVAPMGGFYWFLFNKATLMTTPVGVDFIDVADNSSYIWHYVNSTSHNQTYQGPCAGSSVIPPPMPLTYKVAYLSVSSANTGLFTVCKKPVLLPSTPSTVFALLQLANEQLPISVRAVLHVQNGTVSSFDGLTNDGSYLWTGYRAGSDVQIPDDLVMTSISDGDHIEFRYVERSDTLTPPGAGLCPRADMTSGPPIADTLVTSYMSVDGGGMLMCGMQYNVPNMATLYQGMLSTSQQHGNNFEFQSTLYEMFGHFITSINGVESMGGFYWLVYDKATLMTTPVGVDFIKVINNSSYIWHYTNNSDHNQIYTGPCAGSTVIPAPSPLMYKIAYLTVSGTDISQTTNNTFKHVCKQLVLINSGFTSVFSLLEIANGQIPISVEAVLNMQESTVTSFNGVANTARYKWTGYRAGSDEAIPFDLTLTKITDGDHIEFRFKEVDVTMEPGNGAPSAGQSVALLSMVVLLAKVIVWM